MARLGKDDLARGLAALRSAVLAVLAEEHPALLGAPGAPWSVRPRSPVGAQGALLSEATTPLGAEPGSSTLWWVRRR